MAFFIASSPHAHIKRTTSNLMAWVMLAAIPGMIVQCYYFGWGTLIQLIWALLLAACYEGAVMFLRKRGVFSSLKDNSAFVSAWLLAVAIPPLAPWWVLAIGLLFAIVIGKQLYGGMGQNPFNPAMVGYVVLLVAFPVQMTSWLSPNDFRAESISLIDAFSTIFTGFSSNGLSLIQLRAGVDGITMATPLDNVKTSVKAGYELHSILEQKQFGVLAGAGWQWVNLAYLIGGVVLIRKRIIQYYIPAAFLVGALLMSALLWGLNPETSASPLFHLFSGATMIGAFFIATDPVTASTTVKGRLIYGLLVGALMVVIRTWGGYPDGVAFAILLANMCVPLIDYYTRPRTYGY